MNDAPIRLAELVLANGRSVSPYVWRIRYALAHKGLAYESLPVGFTEIAQLFGGRFKVVPILAHGEMVMNESWDIATYLDRAFADRPPLFATPAEYALARLCDEWLAGVIMRPLFAIYALDIHNAARPQDQPYYRQSREQRLRGRTLEAYTADRASQVAAVRLALNPLRAQLAHQPFLGGQAPHYADYVALAAFHWVASVSTLPLLAADDRVLRDWLERGFDLYDGIGRDARMRPLFA